VRRIRDEQTMESIMNRYPVEFGAGPCVEVFDGLEACVEVGAASKISKKTITSSGYLETEDGRDSLGGSNTIVDKSFVPVGVVGVDYDVLRSKMGNFSIGGAVERRDDRTIGSAKIKGIYTFD